MALEAMTHASGSICAYSGDINSREPEEEKLVHAGYYDRPDESKHPHPQGGDRHGRVISVGDRRANLRVGRIIL